MAIFDRILAELIRRGGNHVIDRAVRKVTPVTKGVKNPVSPAGTDGIDDQTDLFSSPEPKSTVIKALSGAALTRLATRSVPGAILIGGGLLAKLAYDRKRARDSGSGRPRG